MSAPKIGDPGRDRVVKLALRPEGVSIPDVMEEFDVHRDCARRYVLRLVRDGILERSGPRRRRTEVYGINAGGGAVTYRLTREARTTWVGWQTRPRPRTGSGARWW